MRVLVTGGAGYIGSHMVATLLKAGHHVVVVDSLLTGHRHAVPPSVRLVESDVRATEVIASLLREERIEAILHFAARSLVGESMTDPRLYWQGNVGAAIHLLDAAIDCGVRAFVLSSTAAVYGDPIEVPIAESHPTSPVNPYGTSKLTIERMLETYSRAYGLRFAALRYFNAAGADPSGALGEDHTPETHLIPNVLFAALGKKPNVTVFGTDWPTPDGTCVRDYIHVLDLADAHLAALEYLVAGGESGAFNLGTGVGQSVRQVIEVAQAVSGRPIPVVYGPRREGDPPILVASPERARQVLRWTAARPSLEGIVRDAWRWHSRASI